ncbi:MAG: hypothetical protein AAGL24_09120 [Pseudomonadota bacterium]
MKKLQLRQNGCRKDGVARSDSLEHRVIMLHHLMIQIGSLGEANGAARCGASGKPFNEADGLIWFTKHGSLRVWQTSAQIGNIRFARGRIFSPAGRRCDHLVVVETTAATAPSQQSGKYGQMLHHYHPML